MKGKFFTFLFLALLLIGSVQALASEGERCSDEILQPFVGPCGTDSHCPSGYTCNGNCVDAPSCSSGLTCENFICEKVTTTTPPVIVDRGDGQCKTFDGEEWCCDDDDHVFCGNDRDVCGTPDYCQNLNNPELSCRLNDPDWCCDDAGYIIDYASANSNSGCCSPDYPFYSKTSDSCWNAPIEESDNYYTRLSQCDYFWQPSASSYTIPEESCSATGESKVCALNGVSQWINGWNNKGTILGECGVECTSDSHCPADEELNNFCNVNQIMKTTREYHCSNSQCTATDTTNVIETCPLACDMVEPEVIVFHTMATTTTSTLIPQCTSCDEDDIVQVNQEYFICRSGSLVKVLDLVEFSETEQQALLDQINLLTSTVEEKAQLILELTENLQGQADIVNDLQLSIQEKADLILSLTSNIDEQNQLVSQLELNLEEKVVLVDALNLNIQDQANTIASLTSQSEEQATIINNLNLNIQQQTEIINEMELTVSQQAIVIENLDLNIQEQATIISNLNINLQQKIELVSQLELTNEEQIFLIEQMELSFADQQEIISALDVIIEDDAQQIIDLKLTVSQSADFINELELTVAQQSELISQLELTNFEQAELISQLRLNNEEMATIISTLDLQVADQAEIIRQLNLELTDDAEIIKNLNLQLSEEAELVDSLSLTISDQVELISQLELSVAEERVLVEQLKITIQEQLAILAGLEEINAELVDPLFEIWGIKVTYLSVVIAVVSLILLSLLIVLLLYLSKLKRVRR